MALLLQKPLQQHTGHLQVHTWLHLILTEDIQVFMLEVVAIMVGIIQRLWLEEPLEQLLE